MDESDDLPTSDADQLIERGETYDHTQHGCVEVTGIWKGVEEVDSTRSMSQKEVIIVRYSSERDGESIEELTDTLTEFLEAIE